jgi:Tol biopolymer transport system component
VDVEVSESTVLDFDISPDGETIVIDLLGQLWSLPIEGGVAHPLTQAVRDTAEDHHPAFSPDGERIVFHSDRPGGKGLWLMAAEGGEPRRLTQGNDLWPAWSPDGWRIAFSRENRIHVYDLRATTDSVLTSEAISSPGAKQATWSPDGDRIAFVRADLWIGWGQIWEMDAQGGEATPLTPEGIRAWAPAYSPDGERIAFFMQEGRGRPFELRVLERNDDVAYTVASHRYVGHKRLRWSSDARSLYYPADGTLWKVEAASAEPPQRIPFAAKLSFERRGARLRPLRFPAPGSERSARGFMGLAISPSGREIAILALGRLWHLEIGDDARPVTDVPATAVGLSWSPDGTEVAWSAGAKGEDDLFATDLATGETRRLTALPGRDVRPSYSPDGEHIAFVHAGEDERVRVIPAHGPPVALAGNTRDFGPVPPGWTAYHISEVEESPQWSSDSRSVHLCGVVDGCTRYVLPGGPAPQGEPRQVRLPPVTPAFLRWQADGSILFVHENTLWTAPPEADADAFGEPRQLIEDPALYPSVARDGSVLYVSEDGLTVRRPDGSTTHLGWPLDYRVADAPEPLLVRNALILDGTSALPSGPSDIFVEGGRISRIRPAGESGEGGTSRVIDVGGRVVMPGLIALHEHIWNPELLPGLLYHGITTMRDPGSPIAWTAGRREMIESGALAGPRIVFSGLSLHPSHATDFQSGWTSSLTQRVVSPEAGERGLLLARAFGAGHVKMREVYNLNTAVRLIDGAHRLGLPISGHHVFRLPLLAAGIDGSEHAFDLPWDAYQGDRIRLLAAADIWVVPDASAWAAAFGGYESTAIDGPETAPFLSPSARRRALGKTRAPGTGVARTGRFGVRANTRKMHEVGLTIGVGTDVPSLAWAPWESHSELEELVHSGFSPMEAIVAATRNGAEILGASDVIGTIEEGKLADFLILDADPLEDIRNTRRIWMVIKGGQVVDREKLLGWLEREIAAVDGIR